LEKRLNAAVLSRGGLSIKLLPFLFAGLPDRLVLLPGGVCFFVEVKTTGEIPSPIQLVVHKKIRSRGFRVYVIDCLEDLAKIKDL
jgi:hypothetical protein